MNQLWIVCQKIWESRITTNERIFLAQISILIDLNKKEPKKDQKSITGARKQKSGKKRSGRPRLELGIPYTQKNFYPTLTTEPNLF